MWRQFVAQAELFGLWCMPDLLAQGAEFDGQQVDLLLLAEDGAVQFVDQVFGVADLDFQFGDAGFQNASLLFVAPVAQGFLGRWRWYVVAWPDQRQGAAQNHDQANPENYPTFVHGFLHCLAVQFTSLRKKSRKAVDIGV